ncbi:hypothetical protein XF35_23815 [Streptomyces platensis subsp. clarensis]|nr:hypothetical protein [Streptomyces platensis subsp. clarensis]
MAFVIVVGAASSAREVLARQQLAAQLGYGTVNAAIDHGNGDTFSGAQPPHALGLHRVQMPLA